MFYDLGDRWSYYAMDTCIHREGTEFSGLCARCEDAIHAAQHPTPEDGCYACKLDSVHLGFTWGREDFHGPTIKERQDKQIAECAADGVDIEPVGTRWV